MISIAVSCPHPPLLLTGLPGGPVDEVDELRSAARTAVAELVGVDRVVVVGAAAATGRLDERPSPVGHYSPRPGRPNPPVVLPLALAVGRDLLEPGPTITAEYWGIDRTAPAARCAELGSALAAGSERVGLLVLADGSARRSEKAPGHLDDRARPFDAAIAQALAGGDADALLALDVEVADELMVAGRAAWQVLAAAWGPTAAQAELRYSADPFGVWYPIAVWRRAG